MRSSGESLFDQFINFEDLCLHSSKILSISFALFYLPYIFQHMEYALLIYFLLSLIII